MLTHLDLSGNFIGGRGATNLADALKANRLLTSLRLASNRLGSKGGAALELALRSHANLTVLDLSNTGLDTATQRRIDDAFARRPLAILGDENPPGAAEAAPAQKQSRRSRLLPFGGVARANQPLQTSTSGASATSSFQEPEMTSSSSSHMMEMHEIASSDAARQPQAAATGLDC